MEFEKKRTIVCKGRIIDFSEMPAVMGILNITPDSFFDGGRHSSLSGAVAQTAKMLDEGATIIDIGAYSSRPGAAHISEKEEAERLEKILTVLAKEFPDAIFSVDTFRAEIARLCVEKYGVSIINDISGGEADSKMFDTVADLGVPYVMMHMKGTPQNMQQNTDYKDFWEEIIIYFSEKINRLQQAGVCDIIIDTGFGFSKNIDTNYEMLQKFSRFEVLGLPLLAGISRKSMIWRLLEISPDEALNATTALNMVALSGGADILRVHDVKQAVETVKLHKKLKEF